MHPSDAQQLAWGLIREHGLVGWRFRFDHARRRFGCCRASEKTITLSRPLTILNSSEQVRDTILHEIAHALTSGDGHGAKWRAMCRAIGADAKRCYDDDDVRSPARRPRDIAWGAENATGGLNGVDARGDAIFARHVDPSSWLKKEALYLSPRGESEKPLETSLDE